MIGLLVEVDEHFAQLGHDVVGHSPPRNDSTSTGMLSAYLADGQILLVHVVFQLIHQE